MVNEVALGQAEARACRNVVAALSFGRLSGPTATSPTLTTPAPTPLTAVMALVSLVRSLSHLAVSLVGRDPRAPRQCFTWRKCSSRAAFDRPSTVQSSTIPTLGAVRTAQSRPLLHDVARPNQTPAFAQLKNPARHVFGACCVGVA